MVILREGTHPHPVQLVAHCIVCGAIIMFDESEGKQDDGPTADSSLFIRCPTKHCGRKIYGKPR